MIWTFITPCIPDDYTNINRMVGEMRRQAHHSPPELPLDLRCIRSTTWSPSFRNKQTQEGCSSISKPMRVNDGHNEGNISISCTGPGIGQAFHTKKGMTKVAPVKLNCSACGQFIVDAWCQTAGDGWWEVYARAHNCMFSPFLVGISLGTCHLSRRKDFHIFLLDLMVGVLGSTSLMHAWLAKEINEKIYIFCLNEPRQEIVLSSMRGFC